MATELTFRKSLKYKINTCFLINLSKEKGIIIFYIHLGRLFNGLPVVQFNFHPKWFTYKRIQIRGKMRLKLKHKQKLNKQYIGLQPFPGVATNWIRTTNAKCIYQFCSKGNELLFSQASWNFIHPLIVIDPI